MWLAVILLSCAVIIIGALDVPKPAGYAIIALGILSLILTATGWGPGPHYRGQLETPHYVVAA
jgi:hypothetical protein